MCWSAVLSNQFSVMDMWHCSPLSFADRETEAQWLHCLVHVQKQIEEYTLGVLALVRDFFLLHHAVSSKNTCVYF